LLNNLDVATVAAIASYQARLASGAIDQAEYDRLYSAALTGASTSGGNGSATGGGGDECIESKCMENHGFDTDCCAAPGDGSCDDGYHFSTGDNCFSILAVKTCCSLTPKKSTFAWTIPAIIGMGAGVVAFFVIACIVCCCCIPGCCCYRGRETSGSIGNPSMMQFENPSYDLSTNANAAPATGQAAPAYAVPMPAAPAAAPQRSGPGPGPAVADHVNNPSFDASQC